MFKKPKLSLWTNSEAVVWLHMWASRQVLQWLCRFFYTHSWETRRGSTISLPPTVELRSSQIMCCIWISCVSVGRVIPVSRFWNYKSYINVLNKTCVGFFHWFHTYKENIRTTAVGSFQPNWLWYSQIFPYLSLKICR